MIEKEIVEGNKLIAEFMGYNDIAIKNLIHLIDELKYHSSWNWLMQVVEKIEELGYNSELYHHGGTKGFLFVEVLDNGSDIEGIAPTKIEATWLACVQFIKWYNQQKVTV